MRFWIGFDVGKEAHWVVVLDDEGDVVLSRRVEATEADLEAALSEIAALGDANERVIGIDIESVARRRCWRPPCSSAASASCTCRARP